MTPPDEVLRKMAEAAGVLERVRKEDLGHG